MVAVAHFIKVVCEVGFVALPMQWIVSAAVRIVHVGYVISTFLKNMSDEDIMKDQKHSHCRPWRCSHHMAYNPSLHIES